MIVYGDTCVEMPLGKLARALKLRISQCSKPNLSELRIWVSAAGQIEQAALDADANCSPKSQQLTCLCAEAFVAEFLDSADRKSRPLARNRMMSLLDDIEQLASEMTSAAQIKVPEGFAWYALYPDAYVCSTLEWAGSHPPPLRVVVIGLRSIGTTLAAVVAACLRRKGFTVQTITVRPTGQFFDRRVALPESLDRPDAAIIADEGPGLSGSSMTATAEALNRLLPNCAISFFAGHANGPGPMASERVRDCWQRIETCVTHLRAMRFGGHSFDETLLGADNSPEAGKLMELSAATWTKMANIGRRNVHSHAPALETPKYLAKRRGSALVWKFAGFVASPASDGSALLTTSEALEMRLQDLNNLGITVAPAASAHGWLATRWINGRHLAAEDADAETLADLIRYIRKVAKSPLEKAAGYAARLRLSRILEKNTKELLGHDGANAACRAADYIVEDMRLTDLPSYGDGRLAPHKWVRTPAGRLIKIDAGGHDADHTAVGPQTLLWEVAGLIVEWNLPASATADLLDAFALSTDFRVALAGYMAAYAAFRAGVACVCGSGEHRHRAVAFYRRRLKTELRAFEELRHNSATSRN
jgi:hypothetical protein